MMKLIDLQPSTTAIVRHLEGGHIFISRMAALGFTPGANVTLVSKSDHGPLLVTLRGTRIALGREEANRIQVTPAQVAERREDHPAAQKVISIALAGQPNVGKSTVFNLLTGLNQHVGNWTGKTIEKKTGAFTYQGKPFSVIDLPGTYSLTASSEEERVARDFILQEKPDLVIAVVDAATLERNLYLVAELLLLPAPVILALNMMDVAAQEGIRIEPKVLETALGIPVVPMAASHGQGITELQETVMRLLAHQVTYQPQIPSILPAHQIILDQVIQLIAPYLSVKYPINWAALKLLEGDEELSQVIQVDTPEEVREQLRALLYQHEDAILDIAGARYEWIARMVRVAVVEPQVSRVGLTARLDRILTHPIWGTLALVGLLGVVFWLTYSVGSPAQGWLSGMVGKLAALLRGGLPGWPPALVEFFAGGLLGGAGMVITFLPILVIFYAILGFMEDTGYLARAAYLTDRWMHLMGLHGKSFLPILLGFGCNVPAVLGTRIIESKRGRLLTILLIPFIPCTARMAVLAVLTPLFFGAKSFWVAWGLVGGNLVLLAVVGYLTHRFFFEDEHIPFIMELPLYHLPNLRTIGIYIWQNVLGFIQKAGTTILVASLVVWALSYFPNGAMMTSYLADFGRFIEPFGRLMGLPWPMLVALITSFAAKENTIATLGVLYGNIRTVLPTLITTPAALALLISQMLFIPCVGTVTAIRHETNSLKWTIASLGLMLALSLSLGIIVYQVGRLF